MQSDKIKETSKILDYWFAIEFLGQDSYEMCTNSVDSKRKVSVYKKNLANNKDSERKQITTFLDVRKGQSLYDVIKKECESCQMGTWGNITIYLGKIKRELCIENIAKYLKTDQMDRPEKSYDDIVIASFQVDTYGRYITHTLSISTVIWAISKLKNPQGRQLSDFLSIEDYQEAVNNIENMFLGPLDEKGQEVDEDALAKKVVDKPPVFQDESVTMENVAKIYAKIQQDYIGELAAEETYGVSFQLFKDQRAREKYEDDNYLGLSHDYFSNDLKMIKELMETGKFDYADGMCRDLINYINAPHGENDERDHHHDLIHVKDADNLELWMLEVLNLKRAPVGKWPSRYMPALMQQVAINFATVKERSGAFGENGHIFSVNGPPGTGKTTLLKEIVASSIIEKAKKLVKYDDPDKAFEQHRFLHGEKPNGGYSKYIPYWYSLKDDSINDDSLLVTSCNNTAVENITKELPLESGILNSLKPVDGDSELMRAQVSEIETLFSVEKSPQVEWLFNGKKDKEGEYKEVYFTEYAKNLFGKSDVWGLVAVPLGKKSNINPFYYQVLEPLHWDFYPNGQFKENRKEKYIAAQKKFEEQMRTVAGIQNELASLGDVALSVKKAEQRSKADNAHYTALISAEKQKLEALPGEKEKQQAAINQLGGELEEALQTEDRIQEDCDKYREVCDENKRHMIDAQEKTLSVMNPIGILTKIFFKKKCQDAENLAESYRRQAVEFQEKVDDSEKQIMDLEKTLEKAKRKREFIEFAMKKKDSALEALVNQERESRALIEESEKKIAISNENAVELRKQCDREMEKFQSRDKTQKGTVLDGRFISEVLSEDDEASTRAQIGNLWTTDYYNREREKLLYDALQLTREFVLNSKCCRDNFTTLGQYWGIGTNEEKKRVFFHKEDKEQMAGALYQTLFLLVPAISSTFASVGTLLRDVKNPGVIGTLVVDEAGQAQPQMAVGALYRSRRAIIVGDPKQVEPVVTDDLKLLKKSYKEELYRYYQDKSLSVQRCADILNPFGTYLPNDTDYPEWVGCPLLVHRRCIAPMYEISNRISYGGIMKQQTRPPSMEEQKAFVYEKSQWMNVSGIENGKKDHFVKQQGDEVCKMLETAFKNGEFPNLYIISPFKSVIHGIRKHIKDYCSRNEESYINESKEKDKWISENIGTVHTFQGKEANEVIFLLGCDTGTGASGAVRWVNSNIVNVAVTRAKYRLYVIGDIRAWEMNPFIRETKAIMDTFALKAIDDLQKSNISEAEKETGYRNAAKQIPSANAFPVEERLGEDGNSEYSVDTDGFISNLDKVGFLKKSFSEEQLQEFGFKNRDEIEKLPENIKRNIVFGMKLYYLLKPVYQLDNSLDSSCCAILFCKALELQLQANFSDGLKSRFPEYTIRVSHGSVKLKDVKPHDLMIGTVQYILRENTAKIAHLMQIKGEDSLNLNWWNTFNKQLKSCADKRNKCCHAQWFQWNDMLDLVYYEFSQVESNVQRSSPIGGVFFESAVGKLL